MHAMIDKREALYIRAGPWCYQDSSRFWHLTSTPAHTHVRLVACIAARDRDAFVALFEIFAPRVKGYMMRGVRDEARSDDLTQEVLLRVWRKAHSYDERRAAVSTWIFTIARSVMIDAIRKQNRPEPNADDEAFVPSAPPPPDQAAELVRRQERLRDAMGDLPEEQSAILRSAYFEGKSLRVISEEHQGPLGTVKSRVRLAFGRLRSVLSSERQE